jgi:predicted CoA-binding protein
MPAHPNILEDEAQIAALLRTTRRIAVLGIKTAAQSSQAAYYVPEYLQSAGAQIVPVPVYYPEVEEILGERVIRSIGDVSGPVDVVDVFRRPGDIPQHVPDLRRLRPRAVWFQLGIRNDEAARELADAGILVVQDRCLMVEWRKHRA